jgi:hypothetical protein
MNRRSFLMATSAAAALGRAQNAAPAIPLRRAYSLNRNWLFGGKMKPGADAPAFDDSKFQRRIPTSICRGTASTTRPMSSSPSIAATSARPRPGRGSACLPISAAS